MQSGTLKFDATDSLTFANISKTLNRGSATGVGGSIVATAKNGALTIADGATLDVSAGSQGDAGSISLTAATGGVTVGANTLQGSGTGTGGSFSMDSATFGDTGALLTTLASGGFTEQIKLRGRTGDLTVADSLTGDEIAARRVSLAADAGKLTLEGQINTGSGKGQVELYSNDDLTLASGSSVTVTGGGEANLGSSSGTLTLADATGGKAKALLDLSDGNGRANLRALRDTNANGVKMALKGEIQGASEVNVEAVQVYSGVSSITTSNTNAWKTATNTYMTNANSYRTNLLSGLSMTNKDTFKFRPGVEAQSSGNMTLGTAIDLSSWRYTVNGKSETGLLSLRAAGNLTLAQKITDNKTARTSLHSSSMKDSWDLRLVAGASGANPLGVNKGNGTLTVTGGIYTENGDISFASGADTIINTAALSSHLINTNLKYTLASYGGSILGEVGNNLTLNAGVIQSSVGDIDLSVAGSLNLSGSGGMGAIRTTGEAESSSFMTDGILKIPTYWTYANAGDVTLKVGNEIKGDIGGNGVSKPWDFVKSVSYLGGTKISYWSADYETSGGLKGIASMAGGAVQVQAGGTIEAPIGVFAARTSSGDGDLDIMSGGNLNGRFMSGNGSASLVSQGYIGTETTEAVISAMVTKQIALLAQQDIWLGTVNNPTIAHPGFSVEYKWNLSDWQNTRVNLTSLNGDVVMTGRFQYYNEEGSFDHGERRVLPASLAIAAAGDVIFKNDFVLAPSSDAQLSIIAGGSIDGTSGKDKNFVGSRIIMSELNPYSIYDYQSMSPILSLFDGTQAHNETLAKDRNNTTAIVIKAGDNITGLDLNLVKRAEIVAGGSITDLHYVGQNLAVGDVSSISVGGEIRLNTAGLDLNVQTGFQHGGPGTFMVAAGGDIDLGATRGIQSYGNHQNAALPETGSDLLVLAGVAKKYAAADVADFFNKLKAGAQEYSRIKADTGSDGSSKAAAELAAADKLEALQTNLIKPFLTDGLDNTSSLNMVSSQISTLAGNSINIMTGKDFNVGKSTFYESSAQKNTGVYTAQGGDIKIFSRGDVNVNESRLMTFYGGDITVWSDEGSIYAGRGSKTAINPSQSLKVMRDDGSYITRFSPPSVGSGVRAMTYNAGNGKAQPEAGDITLVARLVDAGEAGIYGGKVFIGADTVLNSNNISSSGVSVGVPVQTDSGAGLGTLSGSGTLNEGARMLVETTAMGNKNTAEKLAKADSFFAAWLDVKVLGFDENPPN
jgi:hypothetical protein